MNEKDQILLNKLLVKAHLGGLDDIDHRKLTRLIRQADAENGGKNDRNHEENEGKA